MNRGLRRAAYVALVSAEVAWELFQRVLMRSFRIVLGLVLACLALWALSKVWETFNQPLTALTLTDLLILVICLGVALLAGVMAWITAFGERIKAQAPSN